MSRKRIKVSLIFFVSIAFSCTVLWLVNSPAVQGRAPAVPQNTQSGNPFVELNRKAKASKGIDPIAVNDVTSEVINTFAPTDVPAFTQEAMKERVGRAELNYRQGVDKGISEVKVARTVNELADKFALPDYAKVSVAMVRTARVILMLQLPNLIGQDAPADKNHKKKIGSSINRSMSPLEATALTLFLLQQKTLNEAFQVSHKEFYANLHQKQMEKWGKLRAQRDGTAQTTVDAQAGPSMQVQSNTKTDDITRAIKRAAKGMSPDVLLNLADSSLDTLGIKR
jgi:hypothetical protein